MSADYWGVFMDSNQNQEYGTIVSRTLSQSWKYIHTLILTVNFKSIEDNQERSSQFMSTIIYWYAKKNPFYTSWIINWWKYQIIWSQKRKSFSRIENQSRRWPNGIFTIALRQKDPGCHEVLDCKHVPAPADLGQYADFPKTLSPTYQESFEMKDVPHRQAIGFNRTFIEISRISIKNKLLSKHLMVKHFIQVG